MTREHAFEFRVGLKGGVERLAARVMAGVEPPFEEPGAEAATAIKQRLCERHVLAFGNQRHVARLSDRSARATIDLAWSPDDATIANGIWGANMVRFSGVRGEPHSTLLIIPSDDAGSALSQHGHVAGSPGWERDVVFVVQSSSG